MKASLRSVRIAPKKANLVAKMVRGLPVSDAQHMLANTNKKAARILEGLLDSAVSNAKNNENQDPNVLVVKTLVVNKAEAYHRGVPMARGRVRPMRKYLSHIDMTLGIEGMDEITKEVESKKTKEVASQTTKKTVKSFSSTAKKASVKSEKGTSTSKKKDTTASDSTSARTSKAPAAKKKSTTSSTT